jgi:hypothetical protein
VSEADEPPVDETSIVQAPIEEPAVAAARLQYFHRHTRLAGAGFDYHGRPIAILKGRIVGLILFGSYTIAGYFSPWHALGVLVSCHLDTRDAAETATAITRSTLTNQ